LPVTVRPPLPLQPDGTATAGFARNSASQLHFDKAARDGLSPATPPLASRPTWGSFRGADDTTPATFSSASLTAPLGGWLQFNTAGDLGNPGIILELRDARTGGVLTEIAPSRAPHDSWQAVYVRAPDVPFVVHAEDRDVAGWLAFSGPVEMGKWSYLAWQAGRAARIVLAVAGALACILTVLPCILWWRERRKKRASPGFPRHGHRPA
jgi:hypothetical protein